MSFSNSSAQPRVTVRQEGAGSPYEIDADDVLLVEDGSDTREITAENFMEDDHLECFYGNREERLDLLYQARTRDGRRLGVEKRLRNLETTPYHQVVCGRLAARVTIYNDASSGAAVEALKRTPGLISGEQMFRAIYDATSDLDCHAASLEYADLKKFVVENYDRLSPEAREQFTIYERYVFMERAQGSGGIAQDNYADMIFEMTIARGRTPTCLVSEVFPRRTEFFSLWLHDYWKSTWMYAGIPLSLFLFC
jgi:hypothetical protein